MNHYAVYELFMSDPAACESSYLADHFRRGKQGIMRPSPSKPLADAAWRAGRDSEKAPQPAPPSLAPTSKEP